VLQAPVTDVLAAGAARVCVALTICFLAAPLVVAIAMSLDSRSYLGTFPPPGLSWQWFERFVNDPYYIAAFETSIVVALAATAISMVAGGMAAVFIDRYRFPGRQAILTVVMSPLIVPGIVLGFALFVFAAEYGIGNAYVRLIGGHVLLTTPYVVRTVAASLGGIDPYLREAALTLGAREHHVFREITLPLARAGVVSGAVFSVAMSFDDVAVALFLSDATTYTLPVALLSQMRGSFDLTIAAAATTLVGLTVLLVVVADRIGGGFDRVVGSGVYRS
jgi:putative spermidine/putrescine transport system permease protein